MSKRSVCRCLLCQLELHLKRNFAEPPAQHTFFEIARSGPLLSGFPSAFALTAHLRSCRSNGNGTHPADPILLEVLHLRRLNRPDTLLRDILLLSFIPVLHTASRQLTRRYPQLPVEDTQQHLVTSFIETLNSSRLLARESHVAFAISRMAKRNTFAWAQQQLRTPGSAERDDALLESPASGIPEPLERAMLLRHFLSHCQRKRVLRSTDIELLVHIKLEGDLGEPNLQYSNALRQKIKRLLQKLRMEAETPHRGEQ